MRTELMEKCGEIVTSSVHAPGDADERMALMLFAVLVMGGLTAVILPLLGTH